MATLSIPHILDLGKLAEKVAQDPDLAKILAALRQGLQAPTGYTIEGGRLKYKGRLVLPKTSSFISQLLHEFHASPIGGHSGLLKTYHRLASELFWVGMKKTVSDYVAACDVYQ